MLRNQVNVVSKAFTLLFPNCMMLHSLTYSNEIFTTKSTFTQIRAVKNGEMFRNQIIEYIEVNLHLIIIMIVLRIQQRHNIDICKCIHVM